jgi:hypothetical protein
VIEYYRGGREVIDSIYTNADLFFKDATYPTQGLRLTLAEVFGRIAGDTAVPAIHRLETAFGGGKTHTLIACTHIAFRGTEIREATRGVIDGSLLPEPGSVAVAGVAGDELPVHKPKGEALVPYTLWGEIAYQIGGESLYREVRDDAESYAAPGRAYFDKVFSQRKVLLMLDELAQYAARLEAARPDGASQLAAFLMALHGHARNHPGIAVVLTLAGTTDAFSKQTKRLAELVSQVRGETVSEDDAVGIGEEAVGGVVSVVGRDAVPVTPVHSREISSVLAKRLFVSVDRDAAKDTAERYMDMYRKNASTLPEEASRESFRERMIANYPFHPTLVDFLNTRLADAENFQGTRGVLRVLSLAARSLWQNRRAVPMIHTCHLDMRSDRVVNEILGRTGSSDLLLVLNADIGSVDTGALEGGLSNAETADRRNPHPLGFPLYEYTWKTVFLSSLVGREKGLESKTFGITESDAMFAASFPDQTPTQVKTALDVIKEGAFYLRFDQGKYFASREPTINNILARIRKTLTTDQVEDLLKATARKIVTDSSGTFNVQHDVSFPEDLPDEKGRSILGIVSPIAKDVDVEAMVTTKGVNKPRLHQNLIFLLVPEIVSVKGAQGQETLFQSDNDRPEKARREIDLVTRQVAAMRILKDKSQNFGVNPARLQDDDFQKRQAEREQALVTAVSSVYTGLYYPSTTGHIVRREFRTASGEGGVPFIEQIRQALLKDGELVTSRNTTQSDLANFGNLFFGHGDTVSTDGLRQSFSDVRSWPVLESPEVLDQVVRAGVQKGAWCVFRMGSAESVKPAELYDRENEVPMSVNLTAPGYGLVTPQGAKQRGWTDLQKVDQGKLRDEVMRAVAECGSATVQGILESVVERCGDMPVQNLQETVVSLVKDGRMYAYHGGLDQDGKPDLIHGPNAVLYTPMSNDILITPAKAAENGWIVSPTPGFKLSGRDGANRLLPVLRQIGSIYNRGAKSTIDSMDLVGLRLPKGGVLRVQLSEVPPQSMRVLDEFFEVLTGVVEQGSETEAFLEIADPDKDCPLVRALSVEGGSKPNDKEPGQL